MKTLTIASLLTLLVSMGAWAESYNWIEIKNLEDGSKVYLAHETIDKVSDPDFVSFMTKVILPENYSDELEGVSSFIAYRMGNCEQRMEVDIAIQYYSIVWGEERILKTVESKEDWNSIYEDNWSVLDEVCIKL